MFGEKSYLLKNPVAHKKIGVEFHNPSGDILEDIQEQELKAINGGITPAISWGVTVISTLTVSAVGAVSVSATNPGRVCTVSAECTRDYQRCD